MLLVGQGRKFELWDEARWIQQRDEAINTQELMLPPEMENLSL